MKTKQKFIFLALAIILLLSLTACGAAVNKSKTSSAYTGSTASNEAPSVPNQDTEATDSAGFSDSQSASGSDIKADSETGENVTELPSADKIIYSGSADIETLEFDKSTEALLTMVSNYGGFVQSSNVTGGDLSSMYSGRKTYRSASYTLRIPVDKFKSVEDNLSTLGNVVSSSTNASNITMQYSDTQSHLDACRTKETRLLELLSKATSMTDILAIENSLSDVRYQIESLTSQIKNWDSQISYSTLSVSVREVTLYSEDNSATIGYGQQLKQTFLHSLKSIGHFFKSLFKFLVGAFPVLLVLAVIAVPVYFIVRAVRKKKSTGKLPPADDEHNPPQL